MNEERSYTKIAEFFRKEYGRMLKFVAGLIDDEADRDVEDVIQDVMLNLFDMADVTRPIHNLSAYIYGALRNRVIDLLRRRRLNVSMDAPVPGGNGGSLADILHDTRYDIAADFEKNEIRLSILDAIDFLSEDERMILISTEFENKSFRELSEETGIPIGTLLSRKSRAIEKIRKRLRYSFND